ncbi:MAG: LysR family transcriptional regulator [Betaproteobacteria bacterium]|nr:LysR family transcriptional regulator [Betaproteobacteria bacterium]
MDLRSIRYFIQIADCGSITRAAGNLGVAQPALSRHVQSLENELGMPLLVRLPRGVRLTAPGRQFLDHCRRALRELERAKEELRANAGSPKGQVILGVSPTLGPLLVPGVVERVRRQCPQVALKIVEHFSTLLFDGLLTGRVDVALLTNPSATRALRLTPLISEPIVVLAAPEPKDTRRFYTLAELSKTPVVVTEAIRAIVDDQIGRYGARLNVAFEVNAVEAIGQLLLRGVGPAVMPISTFYAKIAAGKVAAFPIADVNVQRTLMLAHPVERRLSAATNEVSQIVTTEMNVLSDQGVFSLPAAPSGRVASPRRTLRAAEKT